MARKYVKIYCTWGQNYCTLGKGVLFFGAMDIDLWGRDVKGGLTFHDLRHTFITDMRRAGVDRNVTMAITGHAITDMNQRYDVVEDREKLEAIGKLETYRKLESVPQNVPQVALFEA